VSPRGRASTGDPLHRAQSGRQLSPPARPIVNISATRRADDPVPCTRRSRSRSQGLRQGHGGRWAAAGTLQRRPFHDTMRSQRLVRRSPCSSLVQRSGRCRKRRPWTRWIHTSATGRDHPNYTKWDGPARVAAAARESSCALVIANTATQAGLHPISTPRCSRTRSPSRCADRRQPLHADNRHRRLPELVKEAANTHASSAPSTR